MAPGTPITQYIADLSAGDRSAADRLLPHVYEELRALAISFFQQQPGHHTLQPTALVHEAYVRLVGPAPEGGGEGEGSAVWRSRAHFMATHSILSINLLP